MNLGPCEIWPGRLNSKGYGTRGPRLAHKVAWEAVHGPVPDGYELDHLCNVRACVRVSHLEAVTHAENIRRGVERGTHGAVMRAKTTCPQGHPYDVTYDDGKRRCRACRRETQRRYYDRVRRAEKSSGGTKGLDGASRE